VIDDDGIEWLTVADAARRARVREDTLRQWRHRGKVRAHLIDGRLWVHMGDITKAEQQWRTRGTRPGRPKLTPD